MKENWVSDYSNFQPKSTKFGHWGKGQTGLNISLSGRIFLSDNVLKGDFRYPCHRDLIDGEGIHETVYSCIYSWSNGEPTIWLYPDAERSLNRDMKRGLNSLIGVHKITSGTPVRSNSERGVIFRLGEVIQNEKEQKGIEI
jgi:hypothetical protein